MKIKIVIFTLICAIAALVLAQEQTAPKNEFITIWVHGTKLTPTIVYANFFYRMPGLNSALAYEKKHHKRAVAELLCQLDPQQYALEHFYFFGWNGKLSFSAREQASRELFDALRELLQTYQTSRGYKPKIRIITHSHGGNVVLNIAKIDPTFPVIVDELILLGCPVQDKTKSLIEADCFKKVYAFYSGSDIFQVIDPQGLYKESESKKTFSSRRFDHHDKLRQVHIKCNGRSLMHVEFLCFPFLKSLCLLCKETDQFYASVIPSQQTYEKIIDIRIGRDQQRLIRKLQHKD